MRKIPAMVDLAKTPADAKADAAPSQPIYSYGLCIALCDEELGKLGLSDDLPEVGDMLHMHCMAKVTSVSQHDTESGKCCRVELTITNMVAEDEDEENEEMESTPGPERRRKLYGA